MPTKSMKIKNANKKEMKKKVTKKIEKNGIVALVTPQTRNKYCEDRHTTKNTRVCRT